MAKKNTNTVNQRQFKGEYKPVQPADEFNRSFKTEPNSPSSASQRKRLGLQLGSSSQARPGLAGMQDYKHKPKGK